MKEKHLLFIIDMQNDFCAKYGSLSNDETVSISENVAKFIDKNHDKYDLMFFTLDTHDEDYLETLEGTKLPVKHCIKSTWGHKLHDAIMNVVQKLDKNSYRYVNKDTFANRYWLYDLCDVIPLNKEEYLRGKNVAIDILGVCTDICVVSNALTLRGVYPDAKIRIISDLSAGTTPSKHNEAISVMESCQIDTVKSDKLWS